MIGLTLFKRFTLLALSGLLSILSLITLAIPASAATSPSTGEIQGGKFYVSITYPDQSVEKAYLTADNNTTTITITPDVTSKSVSVSDGKIIISNLPPGSYSVSIKFKVDRDACDHADADGNLQGGFGRCTISGIRGANDRHFSFTGSFSAVVRANEVTYLQNHSDTGTPRLLGSALELNADGSPRVNCGGKGILMSFVVCPMIESILGVIDWLVNSFIQPYLVINPLRAAEADGTATQLYLIWNNIRNFANLLFVLVFFIIIFSQATSVGITNYGIKRLLPRLILIAIGTNVSFFVCAFFVDVFNVLGAGAASLLVNAILNGSATINLGNADLLIALFGASLITPFGPLLLLAAAPLIFGIFIFLLIAASIIFIAAVTILVRQIIIIALVLASPVAFVAGLLPNTQKLLSQWFSAFLRLLAMYPIIMLLFASGKVASSVLQKVGPVGQGVESDAVLVIISFLAFVIPLAAIPFSIKFAGSGLHKIYGSLQNGVQNARKTASNAAVKGAKMTPWGKEAQQHWNQYKAGKTREASDRASQRRSSSGLLGNVLRRVNGSAANEAARADYQARTLKSFEGKSPHAIGDIAQMNRGESVDDYTRRHAGLTRDLASTNAVTRNNAEQRVAALRELHSQFGDQVGTDEFREAALTGALQAGANTEDVAAGMRSYIAQYQGTDADLGQSTGRLARTAKAAGFSEYSAVGYQTTINPATGRPQRTFTQYQIKDPESVLRNLDLGNQETGQFFVRTSTQATAKGERDAAGNLLPPDGGATNLGQAMLERLDPTADPAVRTAMLRDISTARRSKAYNEYLNLVRISDGATPVRTVDLATGTVTLTVPPGTPGANEQALNDMLAHT